MTTTERASQLVARLAETHVGPDAITAAILHEVGSNPLALRDLLAQVLPCYVRSRLSMGRRVPVTLEELIEEPVVTSDPAPSSDVVDEDGRVWVSRKSLAIATAYERLMATQYGTENGYRPLGQCSVDDLEWAAAERRKQAAGHLVEAERLAKLAAAQREYGTTVVAELPHEIVAEIMQRGAA